VVIASFRTLLAILCVCSCLRTAELRGGDQAGTAFTYEGKLGVGGGPGAGYYDITFTLYDAEYEGTQIGPTLTNTFVIGLNGVFMATLDFGEAAFNGEDRWLELAVRPKGNGAFTVLSPPQQLTPTPYALQAAKAGEVAATNIIGTLVPSQFPSSLGLSNMNIGFATITNALTVKGSMVVGGPLTADGSSVTNIPVSGVSGLTDTIKDRVGWVDVVRDFGAVGDGLHDDTTNFQNALNYIFSGPTVSNQTLFIPANRGSSTTYRINGDLVIPQQQWNNVFYDGMHIRGEGSGLARLFFPTPDCCGVVMTNDNTGCSKLIFEDLLFVGPQQLGYNWADTSTGLRIGSYAGYHETFEIQVRDCQFRSFATAIVVSNSWNPRLLRNSFAKNSKCAILLSGVHSPDVQDNTINGGTDQEHAYTDKGIWIAVDQGGASGGGDDGLFINNTIAGCTNAIQNDGDEGIVVLNSHMEICGSYYTATNSGVDTVLQGCYILHLGPFGDPDLEAQRPGALNLCADALARLTMIQVMFDGYNLRPQIDVPSDANNAGYIPPVLIGGRGTRTVRFLGKDKLVLPVLSRGTGMANDSLMILSNTPAAWPVAPPYPGASDVVNSNGLPYLRLSTNGHGGVTGQWTATNRFGW
jgi:parallel beta-helix repeat protein